MIELSLLPGASSNRAMSSGKRACVLSRTQEAAHQDCQDASYVIQPRGDLYAKIIADLEQ